MNPAARRPSPPMLDRAAIALLKPGSEALARGLVRAGVGADGVTLAGFALGLAAAPCHRTGAGRWPGWRCCWPAG